MNEEIDPRVGHEAEDLNYPEVYTIEDFREGIHRGRFRDNNGYGEAAKGIIGDGTGVIHGIKLGPVTPSAPQSILAGAEHVVWADRLP